MNDMRRKPLLVHLIYRLDIGGLEQILVELIRGLGCEKYRHAVICIADFTDFRDALPSEVAVYALHKPPGLGLQVFYRLWRLLRELRPDIIHSCNLAALECQPVAWLAGVPVRIHAEHGRDMSDLDGSNRKLQWIRRIFSPWVHRHLAVSRDLMDYLVGVVGIPKHRAQHIYNGVDIEKFIPRIADDQPLERSHQAASNTFVIGTIGRMQPVKDHASLARAFVRLRDLIPERFSALRLVIVGDGSESVRVQAILDDAGVATQACLTGSRSDTPELLRGMDLFVLPSLGEGIPVTVLEAMASGLPVVASKVGGLPELVIDGVTGTLVPPADVDALAHTLVDYINNPERVRYQGQAARQRAETEFSIATMVQRYDRLYRTLLAGRQGGRDAA